MPPSPQPSSQPGPQGALPSGSTRPGKTPRVLACVLCQQRKVKCTRRFPCENCVRVGASCVPAALTPRRRRRRLPEKELLDRLRTCENLLRQHNIPFEPHFRDREDKDKTTSPALPDDADANLSDDDQPEASVTGQNSSSGAANSERSYEAKSFWDAINLRYPVRDNHSSSSEEEGVQVASRGVWDKMPANTGFLLLPGTQKTSIDIGALHPETAQIFRLWQIYLENVDPLLKVTHAPSLQAQIVNAVSNLGGISPTLEALMFSIYCIAIRTISDDDCQAMFASPKENLIMLYQSACEQALLNCGFLKTSNRDCLTAFFLYLTQISIAFTVDPRSLYSLFGIAKRIAQRMQIDTEVPGGQLSPLETEMRRRLWWALLLFDARTGEMADFKSSSLNPTWTCHIPLNVNDSDLRPNMTEPPVAQARLSEALFAIVRSEIGEYIRHTEYFLSLTTPALLPLARTVKGANATPASHRNEIIDFGKHLHDKYFQFCNLENALHFMTVWTAKGYLARCRLIQYLAMSSSAKLDEAQQDAALSDALEILEADTKIMSSPLTTGYRWLMRFYFPFPAYVQVSQDLAGRLLGDRAKKAWAIVDANFATHVTVMSKDTQALLKVFSKVILRAWEASEARHRDLGLTQTLPSIVAHLQRDFAKNAAPAEHPEQPVDQMGQHASPFEFDLNNITQNTWPMAVGNTNLLYGTGEVPSFSGVTPSGTSSTSATLNSSMNWLPLPWAWNSRSDWG